MIDVLQINSFDWDKGNQDKNYHKHGVAMYECEQVFFNRPLRLHTDVEHSRTEDRLYCLGRTDNERILFISLTIRKTSIRIISARDASKKEKQYYEK